MTQPARAPALAIAYPVDASRRRQHARARLNIPARMTTFAGTATCTLIDLSCTGARVGAEEMPRVGALVIIESPGIELFGSVRWAGRDVFGFEFDEPMATEQVIAMRRYADGQLERDKEEQLANARRFVLGKKGW